MNRAALNEALDQTIDETARKIGGLGFRRRRAILRTVSQGNAGLIEFQKSTKRSADCIFFTVNLAVVCGALLESDQPSLEKARSSDAHLRQRIGMLMPGRPDKWWEIRDGVDVVALASEVSALIATDGTPFVARYLDPRELIALWESGQSPGLTETQRVRYLKELKAKR